MESVGSARLDLRVDQSYGRSDICVILAACGFPLTEIGPGCRIDVDSDAGDCRVVDIARYLSAGKNSAQIGIRPVIFRKMISLNRRKHAARSIDTDGVRVG